MIPLCKLYFQLTCALVRSHFCDLGGKSELGQEKKRVKAERFWITTGRLGEWVERFWCCAVFFVGQI